MRRAAWGLVVTASDRAPHDVVGVTMALLVAAAWPAFDVDLRSTIDALEAIAVELVRRRRAFVVVRRRGLA